MFFKTVILIIYLEGKVVGLSNNFFGTLKSLLLACSFFLDGSVFCEIRLVISSGSDVLNTGILALE